MVSFEGEDEVHQTEEVQTQNDYSDSWLTNVRYRFVPQPPPATEIAENSAIQRNGELVRRRLDTFGGVEVTLPAEG